MSYLVPLKTMVVTALRQTFDVDFPDDRFRDVNVSIEYPVAKQHYPGIWIDYDDTANLVRAGVDHQEDELITVPDALTAQFTRWRFQGVVTMTVCTLSSLERDGLYDALVEMIAFGREDVALNQFRQYVENNDLIAANFNFDEIQARGNAAAPGTPWNTDEIIYEKSIGLDILGEFLLDRKTGTLANLSAIQVTPVLDPSIASGADSGVDAVDPAGSGWH